MWVRDYLADLEADFLAWYGVEDMLALPGPKWLRLCYRLFAYGGVMTKRAEAIVRDGDPGSPTGDVLVTGAQMGADPVFAGLFEVGAA